MDVARLKHLPSGMSLCALCGSTTTSPGDLCTYHQEATGDWAVNNRLMCDFVHRGRIPPRLPPEQRVDDPRDELCAAGAVEMVAAV
jgi:hypothetical protein